METIKSTYNSEPVRFWYFAVLIVLVLLITFYLFKLSSKGENFLGGGVQDQVFTSGATMRRLGQEFSQPGQGEHTTVYNAEIKEMLPGVVPSRTPERLVSEREPPVFYDVSAELGAYQAASTSSESPEDSAEYQLIAAATTPYGNIPVNAAASTATAVGTKAEYMANMAPAARVQEELLRRQLYA